MNRGSFVLPVVEADALAEGGFVQRRPGIMAKEPAQLAPGLELVGAGGAGFQMPGDFLGLVGRQLVVQIGAEADGVGAVRHGGAPE